MTPNHAPASGRADSYVLVSVAQRPPRRERPRRWPKAAAVALGVVLAGGTVQWSAAQRRDAPRISVPATIQAEPASQARLAIEVGPYDALPSNSFLRLRGFPSSVSLTEGHAIAPGAWAIPLFGLPSLRAIVPAGVTGRAEIVITLVGVDGNTLAETRTALVIAAPTPAERETPEPVRPAVVLPPPSASPPVRKTIPAPQPSALSEEARAQAERMLALGSKHLEQGNVSAARMFFQHAADAGLADAALKLGSTYDPAELGRLGAPTLPGDIKEARKWYEKARDLGAPEADGRLGRLGRR